MEGDYFKLSQFPYNFYSSLLGTTKFLTNSWERRGGGSEADSIQRERWVLGMLLGYVLKN